MMTTTMATYGRTLFRTKKNTTPNTGRVFAVGAKAHDSEHRRGVCRRGDLTDYGRYRPAAIRRCTPGYSRSVFRAIRYTSRGASCSRSLSSYATPQNGTRGRTLARESPIARFLHNGGTYWKQSKRVFTGRGCGRFREEFLMYLRQMGFVQIPPVREDIELWSVGAA